MWIGLVVEAEIEIEAVIETEVEIEIVIVVVIEVVVVVVIEIELGIGFGIEIRDAERRSGKRDAKNEISAPGSTTTDVQARIRAQRAAAMWKGHTAGDAMWPVVMIDP
jgi:hypothetical protein